MSFQSSLPSGHPPVNSAKWEQLEQFRMYESKFADKKVGCPIMSSNFGRRIADDDNSLRAGARGPIALEDAAFREKITHFDHERIPERVVHARGSGAHGVFKVYSDEMKAYTYADVLTNPSIETPTFVRFSTVLGSRGSADTVRDVRGFATKFYTQQGNWDIVGNQIPVFFHQDPLKFLDVIHAGKPDPEREIPQAQTAHTNFWDIMSLMPEASHMIMWILSDRTIPRSYRTMQGFGVHTFALINEAGQRTFAKFHWRPIAGTHSFVWDEAQKIAGADPDFHRRDLYEAIDNGAYPEYELGVQLVPEADEHKFDFDLLDCTKLIPEELVPVKWIGKMTLNRVPSEFFTEVEQVAYCTQHIVPGIDFTNDPMLQGRNFSYQDTQLTRLGGPNWQELPINQPLVPVINNQRDGYMRMKITPGKFNYWPNRSQMPIPANAAADNGKPLTHDPQSQGHPSDQEKEDYARRLNAFVEYHERVEGMKIRARGAKFQEHYNQARLFYQSLSPVEQLHLQNAAIFEIGKTDDLGVKQRMIARFNEIDHQLASIVAAGVGVDPPAAVETKIAAVTYGDKTINRSPALSQLNTAMSSIKGRKFAIFAADGYDRAQLAAIHTCLSGLGAVGQVVSTRVGAVFSAGAKRTTQESAQLNEPMDFSSVNAAWSIFNSRSVLFDGTIIIDGAESVEALSQYGETLAWISETFKHHKAILAIGSGIKLLEYANLPLLAKLKVATDADKEPVLSQGVVTLTNWTAKDLPASATEKPTSSLKAAASAAVGAVASAVGAPASPYMPNNGVHMFIDACMKHREWDRNVARIPV